MSTPAKISSGMLSVLDRIEIAMTTMETWLDHEDRLHYARIIMSNKEVFSARLEEMALQLAAAVETPWAAVNIVVKQYTSTLAAIGPGGPIDIDVQREQSYCQYVAGTGHSFRVEDARVNPLVSGNVNTVGGHLIQAYYGAPIHSENGHTVGAFCVADVVPRSWKDAEIALVDDYARQTTELFKEMRA